MNHHQISISYLNKKKPNRPFVLKKYLHFWPKMEIAIKNKSMHNFEKELLPDVFTGCSVAIGPLKVGIKKIAFLILNRIMF